LPASSSSSSSSSVRFAKHLATLSNGCAPPCTRLESLGWLLFESQRQQAALGLGLPTAAGQGAAGPDSSSSSSSSEQALAQQAQQWLATVDSRRLLEQVRLAASHMSRCKDRGGNSRVHCASMQSYEVP
jgi:hypothetical protein